MLQRPQFLQKSEPDRAQTSCTKVECGSVLTGTSSVLDTTDKVSNLRKVCDARWWSVAGRTVKCGNKRVVTLLILRNGLPPQIRQFVPAPMSGMTVGHMIDDIMEVEIVAPMMQADAFADDHQAPVDDAGLGEPQYEVGPVFPEDPIFAVLLQEIPAQEAEVDMDAEDQDVADIIAAPKDQPEDPPVIDISNGDEEYEEEFEEEEEDLE
ncbi:hypothetical protein TIFTF001_024832 [Ficus carica]|uniref:Uncharacterized protein n=1 Tax=Ficus carica TaxID=3494 RepID=A0AA88AQD5_FICCA|nr:hypothetical protein TIFTF001_024832 [Ficus carica]